VGSAGAEVVAIVVDHWTDSRHLFATVDHAETYIGQQEGARDGRFGLDVCDDHCPSCGVYLSSEAWLPDLDNIWYCPQCGEPDPRRG